MSKIAVGRLYIMNESIKNILRYILPAKIYLQLAFRMKFGYWIDFNNPQTLNEKLQWGKIFGYKDIHKIIADKYAVRQFVIDLVGDKYLIPLVGVLHRHNDLDYASLPNSFVAKSAHGSGQIIIVRDKSEISESYLNNIFKKWLKTNFYRVVMEPQYRYITPKIVIEKFIADDVGQIPNDYKFHCIAGKVEMIQVDVDRFGDHRRNFYNSDWELLPFTWGPDGKNGPKYPQGGEVEKPQRLDEMLSIAETLSSGFAYIRVDLYCVDKVYFGELTLHHEGGMALFDPPEYDIYFGKKMID